MIIKDAAKTLDLDAVQAFALVASLTNFTRVAEASGTTQAAVSLKLKRLEGFLGRRLVERTPRSVRLNAERRGVLAPRSVRLTADGEAFLPHARALLEANQRALAPAAASLHRLRLGISDHAVGTEVPLMPRRAH